MNRTESRYRSTAVKMDKALLVLLEKKDLAYITVKELCATAGVNRSTFYLHYETIGDLLAECADYCNRQCFDRYSREYADVAGRLATADLEELVFISPGYLRPYFAFVRENRPLFKAVFSGRAGLDTQSTFNALYKKIFSPVLDRFRLPEQHKAYIISFYIAGLMAIVAQWIREDCRTPIDSVIAVTMQCILPPGTALPASGTQKDTEAPPCPA